MKYLPDNKDVLCSCPETIEDCERLIGVFGELKFNAIRKEYNSNLITYKEALKQFQELSQKLD